jgi:hypothetical protein
MTGNGRRLSAAERVQLIERARRLRAQGRTFAAIATALGVSVHTAHLWARDTPPADVVPVPEDGGVEDAPGPVVSGAVLDPRTGEYRG